MYILQEKKDFCCRSVGQQKTFCISREEVVTAVREKYVNCKFRGKCNGNRNLSEYFRCTVSGYELLLIKEKGDKYGFIHILSAVGPKPPRTITPSKQSNILPHMPVDGRQRRCTLPSRTTI
ncbi:hypothetical protein GQX74_001195 [Glossina fuscipes]|nr:hypothetical protein GQX74_001195 [Glossina fuscipes]